MGKMALCMKQLIFTTAKLGKAAQLSCPVTLYSIILITVYIGQPVLWWPSGQFVCPWAVMDIHSLMFSISSSSYGDS